MEQITEMAKVTSVYILPPGAFRKSRGPMSSGRPKKDDFGPAGSISGEEFIGVLFLDDEDGDRSFNFQMADPGHGSGRLNLRRQGAHPAPPIHSCGASRSVFSQRDD